MVAYDWSKFLLLPPATEGQKNESSSSCFAPSVMKAGFDNCGRAYHYQQYEPPVEVEDLDEDDEELQARKDALSAKLNDKKLDLEDYYAILGLKELSWKATTEDIKANWKLISFICHPDKSSPEDRPWGEKRFKAQQLAFKTLSDKQGRIGYDSALPFDEATPKKSEGTTEATFYKVFAPVFERNSRFSIVKPVPQLGDKDSSYDHVNKFYDHWLGFKSWRDFTHLDEHKNDDGTDRYTKRENDRKNKKLRQKAKKDETKRVRDLVEGAMKKDPRVQRQIAEEKAEKERIKKEKKLRRQQQATSRVDQEKAAKEAAAKAEADKKAAEEAAKLAASKQKSNRNKMNKKFKKCCKCGRAGEYDPDEVLKVVGGATHEQIEQLITAMTLHAGPGNPPMSDDEVAAAQALFKKVFATL